MGFNFREASPVFVALQVSSDDLKVGGIQEHWVKMKVEIVRRQCYELQAG